MTERKLVLHPHWTNKASKSSSVKIRCFYTDSDGSKVPMPFVYNGTAIAAGEYAVVNNVAVGMNFVVDRSGIQITDSAFDNYEYKPGGLVTHVDEDADKNVIELEYVNKAWRYQVEYWVRLRNIAQKSTETWLPDNGFDDGVSYVKLPDETTWTSGALTSTAETVALVNPRNADGSLNANYSGYMIVGYRLATESDDAIHPDSSVLLVPGDDRSAPVVVRVYLEADPALMKLESRSFPYDGTAHARDLIVGETETERRWDPEAGAWTKDVNNPDNLKPPENVSYTAYRQYWNLSKDPPESIPAPKDSGSYAETAYITAIYHKDGEADKTYLIWKSADYDKSDSYLTVTPRNVTLESASVNSGDVAGYQKGDVITGPTLYVVSGDFVEGDFSSFEIETSCAPYTLSDGTETERQLTPAFVNEHVTFAVDAFRRNEGVTTNVFAMNLPANIEKNYNITKRYGTLTVTG